MAESDYTYVAERECPVCNKKIKVTMVRTRLIKTKQDSDFCTYYKDINPYYYSIWVCEHCGYAAQDTYFESINERDKKVIAEFLKSREISIKIDLKRSREQALVAFKLAIYYADLLGMPASKMGGLYLKLAWIYRADKMEMDEKKVLKPIDEMLADPWQVDIQELFEASVNEPDEIKKNLYDSLYTYILQKRQEDIINRPDFVV